MNTAFCVSVRRLVTVATYCLSLLSTSDVFAQTFQVPTVGSTNQNAVRKVGNWALTMATDVAWTITALACLALVVVIGFAIGGRLRMDMVYKILAGCAALTGVSWAVAGIIAAAS